MANTKGHRLMKIHFWNAAIPSDDWFNGVAWCGRQTCTLTKGYGEVTCHACQRSHGFKAIPRSSYRYQGRLGHNDDNRSDVRGLRQAGTQENPGRPNHGLRRMRFRESGLVGESHGRATRQR